MSIPELQAWYADGPVFGSECLGGRWEIGASAEEQWKKLDIRTDLRAHVGIDFETLAHSKSKLFVTQGAAYDTEDLLLARVDANLTSDVLLLGGERRLATFTAGFEEDWICPDSVQKELATATQVAMVLATPACFEGGWRPVHLSEILGVEVKPVSALCRRREAISGWDLLNQAPKPVRWLAPAGSVYFLPVAKGAGEKLATNWLKPVSDDPESRMDGFGLALFFPTHW